MQATILSGGQLELARAWARERALDQALLLADLTQVADESLPAGVLAGTHIRGLACCYTGLPFLAVGLWSEAPGVAAALLRTLATHQPRLQRERAYALVREPISRQLQQVARVEEVQEEVKRVYSAAAAGPPRPAAARWQPVPLDRRDLPALAELHAEVPAVAWTPRALEYGPARGIYVDGRLAAAAGVHFCTPWVAEIGHIATLPGYRRQGMAEAAVRALLADLEGRTEHIFLMHFADNVAAARLYRPLGFLEHSRLLLTGFHIC